MEDLSKMDFLNLFNYVSGLIFQICSETYFLIFTYILKFHHFWIGRGGEGGSAFRSLGQGWNIMVALVSHLMNKMENEEQIQT